MKTCPDCNGDGVVDKGTDDEQRCPTCGGSGFVPDNDDDDDLLNHIALIVPRVPLRSSRILRLGRLVPIAAGCPWLRIGPCRRIALRRRAPQTYCNVRVL